MDDQCLTNAIDLGCRWLVDVAQIKTDELPLDTEDSQNHRYASWRGCIRGEYSAAKKRWGMFCPVWHTGQAVKALVLASKRLGNPRYHEAARSGADFIFDKQIWDESHPDHGLILAYEDHADKVNTSAVMECMEGLMRLADDAGLDPMWQRIVAAGDFLVDRMFIPDDRLFHDVYDPGSRRIVTGVPYQSKNPTGGHPLVDDAILIRLYERSGDRKFLDVHVDVSEQLVADQNPPGNWIDYGPCDPVAGRFHPRHTYWWGMPLIETYRHTGRREFLETAIASGDFCLRAMRRDGGYIRGTYDDFNTDSFGHATSGSACAAILFLELYKETRQSRWLDGATKAIRFNLSVQFTDAEDPNLQGAVLEKVLPPDGTDRSPYHLRDLGTIFFIIAAVKYLECVPKPLSR